MIGQPARLSIAEIPRNQRSPLSRIKSLAYLDNILAARQASQEGCDDALILNLDGRVACSTIANVFAVKGTELITPPVTEGCLDGIARRIMIEEAAALGLTSVEAPLTVPSILAGDGCFLTNSVRLLRPVASIGGTELPASRLLADLLNALLARIRRESGIDIGLQEISPAFSRYPP
jgi:branched-chain amino acid aminotransferase